ncbi:ABC transporter permease [Nakamurella deserti]|uniref:ABC transporter permease n=1 Tax=Nakamurella deserti TaxID=2164074 RepID=UPI003B838C20
MLVAKREMRVKLRDRAFLIGSLFTLVIVAAATILPSFFSGGATTVAAVGDAAQRAAATAGAEVTVAATPDAAEALVRDGSVDAALIPDTAGTSPFGVSIVALEEAPTDLVTSLSLPTPVQLLEPSSVDPALAFLIPFAFAIIFFMTSLTFGLSIAQSVVEEKQTRIVEILVAAIPVRALLAGKVLGNTVLAVGQIVLIVAAALVGMRISGTDLFSGDVLAQLSEAILWFVPFFLLGFLLLAGLWAVAGALVSRIEDLGSATTPVQLLVMLPFFGVIYGSSQPTLMTWLSYVPFSAPTAMPVRIFNGEVGVVEPLISLAVLAATATVVVLLAARLYQGSVLRTNGKTSYAQAWKFREKV